MVVMNRQAAKLTCHGAMKGARRISTTASLRGSPLFALGALSNARETQHLAKESRLSRVEHSPNLQLIQSSEVAPFARAKPASPPSPAPYLFKQKQQPIPESVSVPKQALTDDSMKEADLMSVGRAILADKDQQLAQLRDALEAEKSRSLQRETNYALARTKSRDRIARLQGDFASQRLWKWTFLVLGLSGCTWLYASEKGQVSYTLGNASRAKEITNPVVQIRAPDQIPIPAPVAIPVAPPSRVPPPLHKTETIAVPSPSLLSRLFWRS